MHEFMSSIHHTDNCEPLDTRSQLLAQMTTSRDDTKCVTWNDAKIATSSDTILHTLLEVVEQGFPKSMHELPCELHRYYKYRGRLCSVDGVITFKNRILMSEVLQQQVLDTLH